MDRVAEVGGHEVRQVMADQVLPDDGDGHARRAHVFLHAAPDESVIADVAGAGEEHGRLVGHQHVPLGIGQRVVGGAVDGLVFADVDIVGVGGDVQVGAVRNVGEVAVRGGGHHLHLPVFPGLGDGLFGPRARLYIAGRAVFHQVHGHHGELQRAAALDEQNLVVVGDAHETAQVCLGFVPDLLEDLGSMAHLHHAHAACAVVEHLGGDLFQHFLRHHGGAGREVIGAAVLHCLHLLS